MKQDTEQDSKFQMTTTQHMEFKERLKKIDTSPNQYIQDRPTRPNHCIQDRLL